MKVITVLRIDFSAGGERSATCAVIDVTIGGKDALISIKYQDLSTFTLQKYKKLH